MCRGIWVFFLLFTLVGTDKIIVTVKQGKLLGHREATVFDGRLYFAFYGVPYAKPPIGPLRFKDPVPIKKWNGTFDAKVRYHGACAQAHIVHKSGMFGVEDCLYLNIYTPKIPRSEDENLYPVIVWVHGYAFASSFSHIHGPDFLITNDVILATLTHRVGPFGFLKVADSDSHANMGLKDIVVALKWIRANIKQFGGDKRKITLMGSGSGATLISLLMTTEAKKLFSKVILQSGAIFSPSIFQGDPLSERTRLVQELKRKHLKLSTATAKDIISASQSIFIRNSKEMENLQRPIISFTPIIERQSNTSLLVQSPEVYYSSMKNLKKYMNKSILIGYNTQESISEVMPFIHNPYYLKTFIKLFKYLVPFSDGCRYNSSSIIYKKVANLIKSKYFKESDGENLLEHLLKYASDLIKFPIIKFIKTHLSVSKSKMYMYKFDYRGSMNAVKATSLAENKIKVSGVASGDELCYIFKCEPFWENYEAIYKEQENKDKGFIKQLSQIWANFAKFGDPTPLTWDGNVTWLPTNLKLDNVLLIRKYFKTVSSIDENAMYDFWNLIYDVYYRKENCNRKHDEL